jgi:TolB protein
MRLRPLFAAALLVLLAGCAGASRPPEPSRKPGYIAFAVNRGEFNEIWRMQPDGSERRRLTQAAPPDRIGHGSQYPARSPSGELIAYTSAHEIWRMRADGSRKTRLTSNNERDLEPAWSPDGTRIAYVHAATAAAYAINVMSADGHNQRELARVEPERGAVYLLTPTWSPDGTQIAYTRYAFADRTDISIYVMSSDGSGRTRLIGQATSPAWSPDGKRIAFVSDRDHNGRCEALLFNCPASAGELYVANADGSDPRRLTTTRADERDPTWSPDGTRIAFARAADAKEGYDIYSVRPDGSGLRRLTREPAVAWNYQPSWGSG